MKYMTSDTDLMKSILFQWFGMENSIMTIRTPIYSMISYEKTIKTIETNS